MGIALEHENYATGVSMREMSTQVGSTGNNGGAEGLPEMQESVLEHAAPEARQNQGLTSRLADGDYPENRDSVKSGFVRKTDELPPIVWCPCGCGAEVAYPLDMSGEIWRILPIPQATLIALQSVRHPRIDSAVHTSGKSVSMSA